MPTKTARTAPGPVYGRVKEHVLRRIRSGRWRAGDKIPSENELVRELGCARMTISRALRELTDEGWLVRMVGVGTFVGGDQRAESHPLEVRDIAAEIAARGHAHRAEVLTLQEVELDQPMAERMQRATGEIVWFSEIVHWEGEHPLQLEQRWVDPETAPEYGAQDFTKGTPSAYLLRLTPIEAGEQTVRAEAASRRVAPLLHMKAGQPTLVLVRRTWSRGRVVTFANLHHPADRFQLTGRFGSTQP